MKNIKNIVLDYDGTLYNSLKTYAPAFRKAYEYLVANSYAEDRVWSDEEISKWLGISSKDMWQDFMPDLPENEKIRGSSTIESYMVKYIKEGRGELYEGVIDTLNYLKNKEYNLIFLSNCKIAYMNEHRRIFQLDKYFSDY
ncbi:MAG: HAD hydrolase-like protein, partial [Clostridium sp.]